MHLRIQRELYRALLEWLRKQLSPEKANIYGLLTKCEVKMAGYWPSSFFACMRPISSHLDRTSLVNKGFIIWLLRRFFLWDMAGSP